jgi:acrylyl-CoA reductase (NADPH)
MCPKERRVIAWDRLSSDLPQEKLEEIITVVNLAEIPKYADEILAGKIQGRIIVDVNA